MQKNRILLSKKVCKVTALCITLISSVSVANSYERIISATGNVSETISELGLADKLVAVDTTSKLPKDVMDKKPKIGYRRRLSSEGILSMNPDLLILAPDAGPANVIEQIKSANIPIITIKDDKTINGVIADIEMIAEKLGVIDNAKSLIEKIRADEQSVHKIISSYPRKPKIVYLMDGGKMGIVAFGNKSAGNAMIKIVGGENVFSKDFDVFKPVSAETMAVTDMDIIIVASHSSDDPAGYNMENVTADYPKLALTKASKNQCIFRIGAVESLGFGSGVAKAAKEIAGKVKDCIK